MNGSRHRKHAANAGVTLVELMVAIVAGLLLLGGMIEIFIAGKQGFVMQQGVSQAQESGRNGTFMLGRVVRQAGYYRETTLRRSLIPPLFPAGAPPGGSPIVFGTEATGLNNSDTLTVSFQSNEDGAVLDCLGNFVTCDPGSGPDATCTANPVENALTISNTFFLTTNASNGQQSLSCRRDVVQRKDSPATVITPAGGDQQPLIDGVTDFQILYGIDTTGDPAADQYVTAAGVADWNAVRAVRITLVTNSVDKVAAGAAAYAPGTQVRTDNQQLLQSYTETIQLRRSR